MDLTGPMHTFADWLTRVFDAGESVQAGPPAAASPARRAAEQVLHAAFRLHALDVAGPPLPFDSDAAFAAAVALADACWLLARRHSDAAPPTGRPGRPGSAAAHLSADVTLRFLPAVARRARPRGPDDPLARSVADLLRRWPLSGVLAGPDGGPDGPTDFFGHPGLQLLYAERLADHPDPAWVPAAGPPRAQVERVFRGRRQPVPAPPAPEVPA